MKQYYVKFYWLTTNGSKLTEYRYCTQVDLIWFNIIG